MPGTHIPDADSHPSWLSPFALCLAPLASCIAWRPRRRSFPSPEDASTTRNGPRTSDQDLLVGNRTDEKVPRPPVAVQPHAHPRPDARRTMADGGRQAGGRRSESAHTFSSSIRRCFGSDESLRRPQISAPSGFRHLESGSSHVPSTQLTPAPRPRPSRPARPSSFRPLELSIYRSSGGMSPILPHFEFPNQPTRPGPAVLQERLDDDHQLVRYRTESPSRRFHLPRHLAAETVTLSGDPTPASSTPPVPARSQARARAHTSPELESIKARVAGAMIEAERLQQRIDHVIERQSLYAASSRPSTAHSVAGTLGHLEPMPSIPALPPLAPSFAERLNSEAPISRPQTAPLRMGQGGAPKGGQPQGDVPVSPPSVTTTATTAGMDTTHSPVDVHPGSPLSPPLPLVLRPPPLRKKKSFSRVSSWLFPKESYHGRDMSLDSVTNIPRPVKGTEGFYQCVAPGGDGRGSFDSAVSASTWDSDEGRRTAPTTWSPGSTHAAKAEDLRLERTATFGQSSDGAQA